MDDCNTCDCMVQPNPDISGIGVRVSFYLQSILLALLAARSPEQAEITDALTTLVVTNLALCVTTLYLGFNGGESLNLYDGLIVIYLLLCSWASIFWCLPQYNRFRKFDPRVKFLAVFQSYLVFAVMLSIYVKAPDFGSVPDCNETLKVVIFGPLPALGSGRVLGLVGTIVMIIGFTAMIAFDYRGFWRLSKRRAARKGGKGHSKQDTAQSGDAQATTGNDLRAIGHSANVSQAEPVAQSPSASSVASSSTPQTRKQKQQPLSPQPRGAHGLTSHPNGFTSGIDGRVALTVFAIIIVSVLAVTNTELLRSRNLAPKADDSEWGFGQVLPMFLVVLPLYRTCIAFHKHRFRRLQKKKNIRTDGQYNVRLRQRKDGASRSRAGTTNPSTTGPGMPVPTVVQGGNVTNAV